MFEVSVQQTFAAGHALRNYRGKCENVHGHNYKIEVTVQGEQLDSIGLLVDFVEIKRAMKATIDYLDHQFINDLAPFTEINPSAENIAKFYHDRITEGLTPGVPVRVAQVKVWETDTSSAVYRP
jgi:6-pyruvoyltetrahydropterin/6-carboxytetrahydropterin synthase